MTLTWMIPAEALAEDLALIADGVFSQVRSLAQDDKAAAIACLVRDGDRLVAGGSGRTECNRLFVHNLWVAEQWRGQGIGTRILRELEAEAARRGCRDAIIETLEDSLATLYERLGYNRVSVMVGYLGQLNRYLMLKPALGESPS